MELFRDDEDRRKFVEILGTYVEKTGIRCYAWVLMSNHYHLVLRIGDQPLAAVMKPLNSRYASFFNKRHNRRGYLFQDRFKSIATQEQIYIQELVRYVHLNPVRAGICKNIDALNTYIWSSHRVLMGIESSSFLDSATVLRCFGKQPVSARAAYVQFLKDGLAGNDEGLVNTLRRGLSGHDRIGSDAGLWLIGDSEFVKKTLDEATRRRLHIAKYAAEGWDLQRLHHEVARRFNLHPDILLHRARSGPASSARKVFAFLGNRELEIPIAVIARYLKIDGSAVSRMVLKGFSLPKTILQIKSLSQLRP